VATSRIVLERIELQGHIGVTHEEREVAQPLAVDLELAVHLPSFHEAARSDDISRTIDYATVAAKIVRAGTERAFNLLEALAERLSRMLFDEFPITEVHLWVRKLRPPLPEVRGSAGIRLIRTRSEATDGPAPAAFFLDHWHKLAKGHALDVASGRGRHALFLAAQGFSVEAVDRDEHALADLASTARAKGFPNIVSRTVDFEIDPLRPPDLPVERYDAILVFFYLYRPIFPALLQALKPGGHLMYETFLIDNHFRRGHPRRQEFCLGHNELLQLASGLRVLYYDEGEHPHDQGCDTVFTARFLGQK
jgi:dihydroneopterin aldolase